jgi:hypothetical protein
MMRSTAINHPYQRRARMIASARPATWSLPKMFETWLRTVFGLSVNFSAIAALV